MLLTQGQVSIALSSGIVFFFTFALFLSGYAIQQRTLREIRAAIKAPPKPSPKIFLPDRFKQSTTELEDGTIIIVDEDPDYEPYRPPNQQQKQKQHVDVEVKLTVSGDDDNKDESSSSSSSSLEEKEKEETDDESGNNIITKEQAAGGGSTTKTTRVTTTVTSWWRRPLTFLPWSSSYPFAKNKNGKNAAQSNGGGGDKATSGGGDGGSSQKPLSRAERRKRIREEIMKLAEGNGEVGVWQRRLY